MTPGDLCISFADKSIYSVKHPRLTWHGGDHHDHPRCPAEAEATADHQLDECDDPSQAPVPPACTAPMLDRPAMSSPQHPPATLCDSVLPDYLPHLGLADKTPLEPQLCALGGLIQPEATDCENAHKLSFANNPPLAMSDPPMLPGTPSTLPRGPPC